MSQRPAVRSGMRPEKATFRTSRGSPQALATARAPSTSKPIAWFGSVTDVDGKNSMGGYSMSTQSVTVPALTRLVGAVTWTSLAAALPPVLGDALPAPPDWQPAMMRPTARATNRTRADGRITSSPPRLAGRSSSSRVARATRTRLRETKADGTSAGWFDIETERHYLDGVRMADCGDVFVAGGDVDLSHRRMTEVSRKIADRGALVAAVGGDHSISFPIGR